MQKSKIGFFVFLETGGPGWHSKMRACQTDQYVTVSAWKINSVKVGNKQNDIRESAQGVVQVGDSLINHYPQRVGSE